MGGEGRERENGGGKQVSLIRTHHKHIGCCITLSQTLPTLISLINGEVW